MSNWIKQLRRKLPKWLGGTRLSEQDQQQGELFSTHPMSASRAKRLQAETASLPGGAREPFTFDWTRVQQSLGFGRDKTEVAN